MAAAIQRMRDSGIDMMKDVIVEINELEASDSRPTSIQYESGSSILEVIGKEPEFEDLATVQIRELDLLQDDHLAYSDSDDEGELSREDAIQMLVDGEQDIADAVARATELAILEDLEDFEPLPAQTTTYQDNIVNMHTASAYTLRSATYEVEEVAVPEGQDPCGVCHVGLSQRYTGNKGNLEFLCGRSPSSDVAEWWTEKVPNSSSGPNHPEHLNFAFTGTLTLNIYGESLLEGADKLVFPDFGVAQGYSDRDVTWLFGSADEGSSTAQADGTLRCCGWSSAWGNFVEAYFRLPEKAKDTVELLRIEYVWPESS